MREPPLIRLLPDGRRLHLHDGPIDLIVEAFGKHDKILAAYAAAARRFVSVLDELCGELALLRSAARRGPSPLHGTIARVMSDAVAPFCADTFITPMAAVAGAVAETILETMLAAAPLRRAYVNNGGDIALHLERGESFTVGVADYSEHLLAEDVGLGGPAIFGSVMLDASSPVRGIATSGWPGRSFSLGIADAVTILARRASLADAAATIVANAVDLPGNHKITRAPARAIAPDSDLGDRLVTRDVGRLDESEIDDALSRGVATAGALIARGLIEGAALRLKHVTRVVGSPFVGNLLGSTKEDQIR